MNTSRTDNGKAYEYTREDDLIGRPYSPSDEEWSRWLKACAEFDDLCDEIAAGALVLVLLILVFAGVVLWKVWVG